jgi:hypothetical protein
MEKDLDIWWLTDAAIGERLRRLLTRVFSVHCVGRARSVFIASYLKGVVPVSQIGDWEASATVFAEQITGVVLSGADEPLADGRHALIGVLQGCIDHELADELDARGDFGFFRELIGLLDASARGGVPSPFVPRLLNALVLATFTLSDWPVIEQEYRRKLNTLAGVPVAPGLAALAVALLEHTHARQPFAVHLLDCIGGELEPPRRGKLRELADAICAHYGIRFQVQLGPARTQAPGVALSLHLEWDPGNGYLVQAYRFDAEHRGERVDLLWPDGTPWPDDLALDLTNSAQRRALADAVFKIVNEGVYDQQVSLELVLADDLLIADDLYPEVWRRDIRKPLGCHWPVVLRSEQVFLSQNVRGDTDRHWQRVHQTKLAVRKVQSACAFTKVMYLVDNNRCQPVEQASGAGQATLFRCRPDLDPDETHQLRAVVGNGVSVAIWPRRWPAGRCFATELAQRLGRCEVRELPRKLLMLRREIRDQYRNRETDDPLYLTALLWDNPHRRRPFAPLVPPTLRNPI